VSNFCYIHIPFCTSKCSYCRFASFWNLDSLKVNLYVEKLILEIKNKKIGFNNLKSIYFGWWTPSILEIDQLWRIINALKNNFSFDKEIEINIEATPITVTKENIIWWKKLWINRLSIWLQSLNNSTLLEIWRWEKWNIIDALDKLDSVWFNNVSVDFIIGLPYVKKSETKRDIDYILNRYDFIKHISIYMLEEHYYPWNWTNISINDEDYLWEYIEVKELLNIKWFNMYEISNFAKKWFECNHNKAYWNHSNIIAFWLWAHWYLKGERYSNSENFMWYYSWEKSIEKLKSSDIFIENVMFQLRTSWIVRENYEKLNKKKIKEYIDEWFLIKKSDKIILSDKGVLVLDFILREII